MQWSGIARRTVHVEIHVGAVGQQKTGDGQLTLPGSFVQKGRGTVFGVDQIGTVFDECPDAAHLGVLGAASGGNGRLARGFVKRGQFAFEFEQFALLDELVAGDFLAVSQGLFDGVDHLLLEFDFVLEKLALPSAAGRFLGGGQLALETQQRPLVDQRAGDGRGPGARSWGRSFGS